MKVGIFIIYIFKISRIINLIFLIASHEARGKMAPKKKAKKK
jgi:hypothetical protein